MNNEAKNSLWEIGKLLDSNQFPRVYNGGIVKPGEPVIVQSTPGEVMKDVSQGQRRSATGSRQRTTRWQGSSDRPRSTGGTPPLICSSLRKSYEEELDAVRVAYPETAIWQQAEGMWLLTNSSIITGLGKTATFLTAIPYSAQYVQRSWGFWTTPVSWEWIGPRHTNFPDGSICAFEPKDGTWCPSDSIIKLLDLYTLWALRHEHLNTFGRWPGSQSVPWAYERLEELGDDEYCGCNNPGNRYADCCKPRDLARPRFESLFEFLNFTNGELDRYPPPEICEFMRERNNPPAILTVGI